MWLEDFNINEDWEKQTSSHEISEKFKESVQRSSSWIKRVQKDEKKSKKYLLIANQ